MNRFTALILDPPNFEGDVEVAKAAMQLKGDPRVTLDAEDLDIVFELLNHGSGHELPGYHGRSLSVGDVVIDEQSGDAFMCASSGWDIIQHEDDVVYGGQNLIKDSGQTVDLSRFQTKITDDGPVPASVAFNDMRAQRDARLAEEHRDERELAVLDREQRRDAR